MKKIEIYEFQAKVIYDALRLSARYHKSKDKETCMDRDIMQALGYIENALKGEIDKRVPRL